MGCWVLCLAAALSGRTAAAQAQSSPAPAEEQNAFLQLVVNEVSRREVLVIVRRGDVLVAESDLLAAGLRALGPGRPEVRDDRLMVSLASLAPRLRYRLEEAELVLRITVDPSLLPPTTLDLASGRPANVTAAADQSLFVNYALSLEDARRLGGYGEAGLSLGQGWLLYTSGTALPDGTLVRNLSNLTLDLPSKLLRVVMGDSVASTEDLLGGAALMAGINLGTNYAVDPYFRRYPALGFSGATLTPSVVEVYVNGALVRRQELGPGPFQLENLPATTGSGQTRVVVRDAFGRQSVVTSSYYLGSGVLAPGLTELNFAFGARRLNPGTRSMDYDGMTLLGTYRRGLWRWLTAGLRGEASDGLASGGLSLALALPYGELDGSVAASRRAGLPGSAAALSYSYTGRAFNLGLGLRALSPRYANLSLDTDLDRPRLDGRVLAGTVLFRTIATSVQYQQEQWRSGGIDRRLSLLANAPLGRGFTLFANGSQGWIRGGVRIAEVFAGVSWAPWARTTALGAVVGRHDAAGDSAVLRSEVQRTLPLGPGVGYRLLADVGRDTMLQADARAQTTFGRVEATVQRSAGQTTSSLGVAGGVVVMAGDVFFTRPVDGSFALIQVPGVPHVRAYQSNQEVGRTSSRGNLLVPNLLPYYGNRLAIEDKDIPLDHDIGTTELVVAPPFRGGVVVRFPVRRVQSATGSAVVLVGESKVVPAFGQITVTGAANKASISPLNGQGSFYLEDVPPGRHDAEIEFGGGTCRFSLEVPAARGQALIDLGSVTCRMPAAAPPSEVL